VRELHLAFVAVAVDESAHEGSDKTANDCRERSKNHHDIPTLVAPALASTTRPKRSTAPPNAYGQV